MWKDSETEIDYLDYEYMINILAEVEIIIVIVSSGFDDQNIKTKKSKLL